MSLFGDKLGAANQRNAALTALLAVVGLNVSADAALPTPEAFKATLDQKTKEAVDAALAPVNAQLATANSKSAAFTAGLSAAGVKLGDFKAEDFTAKKDAKEGDLNGAASAVKLAVETAIAAKSAKQIAGSGHEGVLDTPRAEEAKTGATEVTPANAEEFLKQYNALSKTNPGAAATYHRKHRAKFLK